MKWIKVCLNTFYADWRIQLCQDGFYSFEKSVTEMIVQLTLQNHIQSLHRIWRHINTTFVEVPVHSIKKRKNIEKEFSRIISCKWEWGLLPTSCLLLCVDVIVQLCGCHVCLYFSGENKYAIYIKVNGHL